MKEFCNKYEQIRQFFAQGQILRKACFCDLAVCKSLVWKSKMQTK